MTIAKKIWFLVAIALAGMLAIALTGAAQSREQLARTEMVTHASLEGVLLVDDMARHYKEMRNLLFIHVLSEPAWAKKTRQDIEAELAALKAGAARYRASQSGSANLGKLAAFEAALAAYETPMRHALDLSEAGDKTAARDAAIRASYASYLATLKALDALNQLSLDAAAQGRAAGREADARAVRLFAAVAAVAALFLIALAVLIVGAVKKPLAATLATLDTIREKRDFTARIDVASRDEVGRIVASVNELIDTIHHTLGALQRDSAQVHDASVALLDNARGLTTASATASASAAAIATSVEQMTGSIAVVAERATEVDGQARDSGALACGGAETIAEAAGGIGELADTIRDTAARLGELQDKSEAVASVVGTIQDIAEQTNLLALNAAIEAARAGQEGRGFAVVADEVRKLAERTTASTVAIARTVGEIRMVSDTAVAGMNAVVEQVATGVARTEAAGDTMRRLRDSAAAVVVRVSDISGALREQSGASSEIAQQVERIAQLAGRNETLAGASLASADQLGRMSETMRAELDRYRL